jgi:hypothetical protein
MALGQKQDQQELSGNGDWMNRISVSSVP